MKKSFMGLFFLVVAVAIFFGWTDPNLKEIDNKKAERDLFDEALESSKELQDLRDLLLEKFNKVSDADLSRLSKMLPDEAEVTELLVEISNVAETSGVLLSSFNAQEMAGRPSSGTVPGSGQLTSQEIQLMLQLTASYEDFVSFLEKLERSLRLIEITQVDFSSDIPNDPEVLREGVLYSFNVNANAFFKK